jgi:hypothetical protein
MSFRQRLSRSYPRSAGRSACDSLPASDSTDLAPRDRSMAPAGRPSGRLGGHIVLASFTYSPCDAEPVDERDAGIYEGLDHLRPGQRPIVLSVGLAAGESVPIFDQSVATPLRDGGESVPTFDQSTPL